MSENETAIVNTIKAHLLAHVFDKHAFGWLHIVFSNAHDVRLNTFVLTANNSLRKHYCIIGMASAIGDPELLRGNGR
jgi:hypothetical protein